MRLLGYYIADGYAAGNENNRQVRFAFGTHERRYAEDVRELVGDIFGYHGVTMRETPPRTRSVRTNFAIARFFESLVPRGAS
jgi:hypothetical protein